MAQHYLVKIKRQKERCSEHKQKAMILTFAPVSPKERKSIRRTDIKKYAINQHAEYLKPDFRICSDYGVIGNLLQNFTQKIITIREWVPHERLIYAGQIQFKGSTIVALIEYLISQNFKEILIVGDNTVHSTIFQDRVNKEIQEICNKNPEIKIYQYSKGNFPLPVQKVKQFI